MTRPISAGEFIDVIYRDVFVSAIEDTESVLRNPPGRNPGAMAIEMQEWYLGLPVSDQIKVRNVMKIAANYSVFGMLCILDNVRPVVDGFEQELQLGIKMHGERFDFNEIGQLHDLFKSKIDAEQS
jgi:hypothetical protein